MWPDQVFDKGDLVVCDDPGPNNNLTVGKLYAVLDVVISGDMAFVLAIDDDGRRCEFYHSRFSRAPSCITDDYNGIIACQDAYEHAAKSH